MGQTAAKILASKLIAGLIYKNNYIKEKAICLLENKFGKIDYESQELNFSYTDYYYAEFGRPLKRSFISFCKLKNEDSLDRIKLFTNLLEKRLRKNSGRPAAKALAGRQINIDPGFLSMGKLILATTKDYNHRVYIGSGIYAEVTLFYKDNSFQPWTWTYPDYATEAYLKIFNHIRQTYVKQLNRRKP